MYDLIGDIHGYADELKALLRRLGYQDRAGVYGHSERTVIFCGDFIDRGPQIAEVLRIVRGMVEGGSARAVMGNHEYNALAFHTERPDQPGQFFRRRSEHNLRQHRATLDQLTPAEIRSALAWFATLPIALDLGSCRIVHACWDPECIQRLEESLTHHSGFTPEFFEQAVNSSNPLFYAVERVLKGPELKLPDGIVVRDKEGGSRRQIRIRWFESPEKHSMATYALPRNHHPDLTARPVEGCFRAVPYTSDAVPVFIGHYWMPDKTPMPLAPNVACLDYSVAKDGFLCAYQFDGESVLDPGKFVTVPGRQSLRPEFLN